MSVRKFALLFAIFAASVLAFVLISIHNLRITRAPILMGIKANQITRLEIIRGAQTIDLSKMDGRWMMTKPVKDLADQDAASQIASALPQIILEDIAAKNPASYADYDLSSSSAARLIAYAAISPQPVLDGYLGRQALDFNSAYFRFADQPEVYVTDGLSSRRLAQSPDDFRERAFFPGGPASIEVRLKKAKPYVVFPSSPSWSTVSGLRISEFESSVPAGRENPFRNPVLTLEARGVKNPPEWIIGSPRREKTGRPIYYYAESPQRGVIALVSSYDIESLLPKKPAQKPRSPRRTLGGNARKPSRSRAG